MAIGLWIVCEVDLWSHKRSGHPPLHHPSGWLALASNHLPPSPPPPSRRNPPRPPQALPTGRGQPVLHSLISVIKGWKLPPPTPRLSIFKICPFQSNWNKYNNVDKLEICPSQGNFIIIHSYIYIWGVSRPLPQRATHEPQIVLFLTHVYDTKMYSKNCLISVSDVFFPQLSDDVGSFSEIFHFHFQKVQKVLYLKKYI